MGMILSLVQFTPEKLQDYLENPEHFEKDLPVLENSKDDRSCYLDKAWDAIHYILTGTKMDGYLWTGTRRDNNQDPLSMVIYSDQFFDEQQILSIAPASYLTPDQVHDITARILELDSSGVRARYNPSHMQELGIYPGFWSDNPNLFEYVDDSFKRLKEFYADAASKGHAVASYLG
jgi:uncharacterized protein DUF1877